MEPRIRVIVFWDSCDNCLADAASTRACGSTARVRACDLISTKYQVPTTSGGTVPYMNAGYGVTEDCIAVGSWP